MLMPVAKVGCGESSTESRDNGEFRSLRSLPRLLTNPVWARGIHLLANCLESE
jgi:hypothetical protein